MLKHMLIKDSQKRIADSFFYWLIFSLWRGVNNFICLQTHWPTCKLWLIIFATSAEAFFLLMDERVLSITNSILVYGKESEVKKHWVTY